MTETKALVSYLVYFPPEMERFMIRTIRPRTNQILPKIPYTDIGSIDKIGDYTDWFIEMRNLAENLIDHATDSQIDELLKQDWLQ